MFLHLGLSPGFCEFCENECRTFYYYEHAVVNLSQLGIAGEDQTEAEDFFRERQEGLLFQSRRAILADGQNGAAESDRPAVISIGKEEALERMRGAT